MLAGGRCGSGRATPSCVAAGFGGRRAGIPRRPQREIPPPPTQTTTTSLAGIPEKTQGQRRLLTVQIPTRQALYQTALRALSQRSHCAEIVRQGHCAQPRDGEPRGSGDVAGDARVGRTSTCASISAAHTGFGSCSLRLHPRASHDNSASSSSPTQLALPDRDVRTRIYLVVLAPEKNCGDNRSHDTAPSELIS